ncbi:nuclear transport factor 2 family protein [Arthrobacter sp. FX8]|uniref:nuclear transport factor 2 family protein n=1 Tax=Arthrobacter sp. FX8 TaxID=2997335 RepID=UPI00227AC3EA|nr:nuclear transport factor 2 family protein [Arthrobacter sp. FX8]WAJ34357.1 nuclear transport factor 2 family protein [Arthrobacter sp. FX8]
MSTLADKVRSVMAAYNNGDPEPLVATFHGDVQYTIVHLDRTYRGLEEVSALAREGAGQTRFRFQEVISHGPLIAFSYDHHNPLAGTSYQGPGLAVQKYDDDGRLLCQWAYRA